jgi:hypothetical protein
MHESRMMGDVDEEVGDNDKNATVWPEGRGGVVG